MIKFGVTPSRSNARAMKLLQSIATNAQKAANAVAYDTATRYRDEVKERLGDAGERFRTMMSGIQLVSMNQGDADLFAVIAEMRTVKVSEVEAELMTVTVVPQVQEAWLRLLASESPWPLKLLPKKPTSEQARLVGRRVRQDEMEKLLALKKPRMENILSALGGYGIDTDVDAEVEAEIHIDTNWEAVRAEYGLDGYNRVPVWQPALKDVLADRERVVDVMEKALLNPRTSMPVERAATGAEIGSIQRFQDMIKV